MSSSRSKTRDADIRADDFAELDFPADDHEDLESGRGPQDSDPPMEVTDADCEFPPPRPWPDNTEDSG